MRVLQVIQEMAAGGAERVVLALAGGLGDRGHDVAVAAAAGRWSDRLPCPSFDLPMVERRPHRVLTATSALHGAIRSFGPDLVHAHNPLMGLTAGLATGRGRRVAGAVSMHGVREDEYGTAARILKLSGLPVVACGPGVAAGLSEVGIAVWATVVNGVSSPPPTPDRSAAMASLGLSPRLAFAVAVGRLVRQKRHDVAVRAIARLPHAALAVVGAGPLEAQLRHLIDELGVDDRVVLAGRREDARELIGAADVAVMTSEWEGLPLVALEAAAAGTPLVATSVRGIRELFQPGKSALLVDPDNEGALAAALRAILDDRQLAWRLGQGGRELAAHHTEDAMVDAFEALYGELPRGR